MLVLAVVNLKGGTTKTTSAAYLAHALHEQGYTVLGVDADGENNSLQSWSEQGDWPFPVVGLAVKDLHKKLPGIVGERYDAVVIDTPPMKDARGIVLSACRVATHVVLPMAPTSMEYERVPAVRELLTDAADLRPDGDEPALSVLLTRTVPQAASTGAYRELLTDEGYRVLPGEVRRREAFAQAYGLAVEQATRTAYGDALTAITEEGVPA